MARKTEDISNKKYGLLTVIRFNDYILVGSKQRKAARFLCKCDCGSETIVRATHLKSGVTKSCGHIKTDSIYDIKQLPSQKFNRLTVVRCTGLDKNKREKRKLRKNTYCLNIKNMHIQLNDYSNSNSLEYYTRSLISIKFKENLKEN